MATDFKDLIKLIQSAVDKFNKQIPGIQKSLLDNIRMQLKEVDTKGNNIAINTKNVRLIAQIKSKLEKIMVTPEYKKSVKQFVTTFEDITKFQNSYFEQLEEKFKPSKLGAEIKKQAMQAVVEKLTENGLSANVTTGLEDLLRKNITGGQAYSSLDNNLQNYLLDNETGEGQLQRYTKQITTDALNQYSGQYTQIVSNDLGFDWFRYSGSNIDTTRPFCLACTKKKFIHISEIPELLKGNFPEFAEFDGVINEKTGLPAGLIPGTDVSNFMINRGGYNCAHQLRPVSEDLVPKDYLTRVYNTPEYKRWKPKK